MCFRLRISGVLVEDLGFRLWDLGFSVLRN